MADIKEFTQLLDDQKKKSSLEHEWAHKGFKKFGDLRKADNQEFNLPYSI